MVQAEAAKEEIRQLLFFSPQEDSDHGGTSLLEMSNESTFVFLTTQPLISSWGSRGGRGKITANL